MAKAAFDVDVLKDQPYDPGIYRAAELYSGGTHGFGGVGEREEALYREDGFFVVHHGFDASMIASVKAAIAELVEKGVGDDRHAQLQFESAAADRLDELNGEARLDAVRKLMNFVHLDPRLVAASHMPSLLAVAERILGEKPKLYQDMALLKPPSIGREKPWHQDTAYFNLPKDTPVIGFWIALDAATPENGCMHFMPGRHKEGPIAHFDVRDWQICDSEIDRKQIVAVPLGPGGALVFNGLTPHGTPSNRSGERRHALQFHYIPDSVTPLDNSDLRKQLFGGDANGRTC